VDMPPGTGDAQLTVSQAFALAGAVIVTLPQAVSQADARRGLQGFRQMEVPILGVVENMSYLLLPNGEMLDVFGRGGGRTLAEVAGVPFIGEVPMDPQVRVSSDTGTPIVVGHPDSPVAQAGAAVGLLDADIYGPNTPMMMGIKYKPVQFNGKMMPARAHGVEMFSMGFVVRDEQPIIWRGPMLDKAIRQFLNDVAWGDLDYLIVDMPPGTGDAQLTVSQAFTLAGAVIVTLPQEVSQADARRGLEGFRQMEVPILGVVENMSGEVFGRGGGRKLAELTGVPFIGEIPLDPQVRVGGDGGLPVVVSHPDSAAAKALVAVAQDIAARVSVQNYMNQNNVIPITEIG